MFPREFFSYTDRVQAAPGEVYGFRTPDGRYAACQVLARAEKGAVEVAELDGLWDHVPTIDEVRAARVAFHQLAERVGVDRDTAAKWFDEWRDF